MKVVGSVLDLVGQTPMVRLRKLESAGGAEVWAKLEYLNPGGSVKDRAALGIVLDAERRGVLKPGGTIVEATAGNTGVGLALIGVNRGYKVMLYVPEQFAEEKCKLMRGLGATVVRTPEAEGIGKKIKSAAYWTPTVNLVGRDKALNTSSIAPPAARPSPASR